MELKISCEGGIKCRIGVRVLGVVRLAVDVILNGFSAYLSTGHFHILFIQFQDEFWLLKNSSGTR
jgi:hypothetical protein